MPRQVSCGPGSDMGRVRRGASIQRTRGLIAELASEGSKAAMDAVPAEEYSRKLPCLPLRGVYHLGVV